jgi:hypothetical protein
LAGRRIPASRVEIDAEAGPEGGQHRWAISPDGDPSYSEEF